MSAFLCGNKTLSCVVDVIKSPEFKQHYYKENFNELMELDILQKLSYYNTRNLNYLYGEDIDNKLYNKCYKHLEVSDAQRHKSTACYLYQTMDTMINRELPILIALSKVFLIHS